MKLSSEEATKVVEMLEAFANGINWAVKSAKQLPIEFHIAGQVAEQLGRFSYD